MLSRADLLAPRPLPVVKVDIPERNDAIYVRVMTGLERDSYEAAIGGDRALALRNKRARLVAYTACDADGKLLFTPEDADQLGQIMSWVELDRIAEVAARINVVSDAAVEAIKGN